MPTIGPPAARIASTSSASTTAAPAKAAAQPAAAAGTGYSAASSFQAATGGNKSIGETFSAAKSVLDGLEGSTARDDLKKLLDKPIPTQKELEASINAFSELAETMSPDERKTVEKAVCLQLCGRTISDKLQQDFEKMMSDLNNKKG